MVEEKYVVVLQMGDKDQDLEFVTAFIADRGYLRKIQNEGGWIETKKAQS